MKTREREETNYRNIKRPTLIVAGGKDPLREPGYAAALQREIADSELVVFPEAGISRTSTSRKSSTKRRSDSCRADVAAALCCGRTRNSALVCAYTEWSRNGGHDVLDTDAVINGAVVSALQITVGVLGALILLVDGFNTQVIGYIAPQIARSMHLGRDVLAWVLSADKVGLLIGYLFVAPLSGYYGHKRVAIGCIVFFGLLAWLTTMSGNAPELFVFRLLTGIGLGGALPSGVALTGEYFPKNRRSTSITFIYCGLSFGQLSAGEVSNAVLQPFGWQGALWAGGALALLLAATLAVVMPESLEYLVNRGGRPREAARILGRIDPRLKIGPANADWSPASATEDRLTIWQLLPQLFWRERSFGTLVIWFALGMNLTVNTSLQVWLTKILVDGGFASAHRDHRDRSVVPRGHCRRLHHRAVDGPLRAVSRDHGAVPDGRDCSAFFSGCRFRGRWLR